MNIEYGQMRDTKRMPPKKKKLSQQLKKSL